MLREVLNTESVSVQIPSWLELIEGMEEQRLAAVDEKISVEIMNDADSYHEFEFKNRNETAVEIIKIDPVYRKRLSETITELVEFSLRLDKIRKPT